MLLLEPNVSELKTFQNFYALENEQKKAKNVCFDDIQTCY